METYRIDPATILDLRSVLHLEKVCFGDDAWSLPDVVGALILPGQLRLKVIADRRMVAFAMGEPYWRTDTSMITTIGVLPEYRRRGVGAALLERCEALLPGAKIRLTVREDNIPALRLYEKFRYRYLSRLPQYYQDGRAGILMEKERRVGKHAEESFGRKQAD